MNYRLIENSLNDINNPQKTILLNRGIENWSSYIALNNSCTHPCLLFGESIQEAAQCFNKHIENDSHIHMIVDSDVDGYTSASMIYRYIKHISPNIDLTYSLHTKKQHGISEDITIPDDCRLLIVPDAGSNDIEQCKMLSEKGIDIIILDHHICDEAMDKKWAILVNNQNSNYPNKNLCGAGVVYKFLQVLDCELWENYADNLLDMVALGSISDVMDMREFETRYYTDLGLKRIKSKLFKALIEKQSYSMQDIVNIQNVQFYITPILNACIRMGSDEEKDILFRAFIETDEIFKYKKRGEIEETDEDIYTRSARICSNVKSRQDNEVKKSLSKIKEIIESENIDKDKIMFVNVSDILDESLTGLGAIKIAEKYQKPCVLLRIMKDKNEEYEEIRYGGSCRNFHNSPIDSLKQTLTETYGFDWIRGHENAAGVCIKRDNIVETIKKCNQLLKSVDFSKCYKVDFEINADELSVGFIKAIDSIKHLFGQCVEEPLVCVKNLCITKGNTYIMGKNDNCWKYTDDNGYAVVMFNADKNKDIVLQNYNTNNEDLAIINAVGKVSISNYKGILTPQFIVEDYEVVEDYN